MRYLFVVLLWPLAEIGLFVTLGGRIGLMATLAWVVLSGVFGVAVLRRAIPRGMRSPMPLQDVPAALGTGLFRAGAGVLLILPGFLTDALGLALLVPVVQRVLTGLALRHLPQVRFATAPGPVVDGDWRDVTPPTPDRPTLHRD